MTRLGSSHLRNTFADLALAAVAVLTACWPGAASAQLIPRSVLPGLGPGALRTPVDVERPPWRGVVLVQTEVGARCTGALIGARTVLTAAHCLFGRGTGRLVRPSSTHVLVGYEHGTYAGHGQAVSFLVGPGFALGPGQRKLPTAPADADWAVLTLNAPLGTADRILPLARGEPPGAGAPAMLGGYEQDRAQILLADTHCAVTGLARDPASAPRLLHHSCAGTRGVSGAPLLVQQNGTWAVAGIASLAGVGTSGGYAIPIGAIAPDLAGTDRGGAE